MKKSEFIKHPKGGTASIDLIIWKAYWKSVTQDLELGTFDPGLSTWDPPSGNQYPEPIDRTRTQDLYVEPRPWDPPPMALYLGPRTVYVRTLTQYLYVERGTHA